MFDKLKQVYDNQKHDRTLVGLIRDICHDVISCIVTSEITDEEFEKAIDFCISFPEWLDKEHRYDGRLCYYIDGVKYYKDEVERLLKPTSRSNRKNIYEVCYDLESFKDAMENIGK